MLVSLIAAALIAAACGDSAETATTTTHGGSDRHDRRSGPSTTVKNTASDTGVTETTIKIAIHSSDLSGLVKAGAIKGVPEDAGPANSKRISYYLDKWNAEGGINGRKFEYQLIQWDPADPKTYQTSCQKIIDAKVFMVIAAGGGFPPDSTPCITVDGKTQYMGTRRGERQAVQGDGRQLHQPLRLPVPLSASGYGSAREERDRVAEDGQGRRACAATGTSRPTRSTRSTRCSSVTSYNVVYSEAIKIANLPTADANKNVALAVEKVKAVGATHVDQHVELHQLRACSRPRPPRPA